jgi:hypothetical protein
MNASKTATTPEDEALARRIHQWHGEGVSPSEISRRENVHRDLVRDVLSGRRLGPAMTDRSAARKSRCPHCGKAVLSLPCLACEITIKKPAAVVIAIAPPKPEFTLKYEHRMSISSCGRLPRASYLPSDSMQRIKTHLICDECQSERMPTPSGSVCPNGHGRIHPRTPELDRRSYHYTNRINKLPKAWKLTARNYRVEGLAGEWRVVKHGSRITGDLEVNFNGRLKVLRLREGESVDDVDSRNGRQDT